MTDGIASGNSLISESSNNLHLKAPNIKMGESNGDNVTYLSADTADIDRKIVRLV